MSGATVSVMAVQLGVFAFLALKCCLIHFSLRHETSLGWLTGALIFMMAQLIAFEYFDTSPWEVVIAYICMPALFYCINHALRLLNGNERRYDSFWLTIAALSVAALALFLTGAPYIISFLVMKLTLGVAAMMCVYRLVFATRRHLLDLPIGLFIAAVGLLYFARIPLMVEKLGIDATFETLASLPLESEFLRISGILGSVAAILLIIRGIVQLVQDLTYRSARDGMTGLFNREAFMERSTRVRGRTGSVLFCDIDKFKDVNDNYGHAAGDAVIRGLGSVLDDTKFLAGRMGGDEFALLMPGMRESKAIHLAKSLRERFASLEYPECKGACDPTASFGVASYNRRESLSDALAEADEALYHAKANGRDSVMAASQCGARLPRDEASSGKADKANVTPIGVRS